jgi:hypothetical protein
MLVNFLSDLNPTMIPLPAHKQHTEQELFLVYEVQFMGDFLREA